MTVITTMFYESIIIVACLSRYYQNSMVEANCSRVPVSRGVTYHIPHEPAKMPGCTNMQKWNCLYPNMTFLDVGLVATCGLEASVSQTGTHNIIKLYSHICE